MNLLNKNINEISFDEVVEFCERQIPEGVQLDYKRNLPKDLSKHFATFSNTQGGLIIIGVEEDAKGLPKTYAGVPHDSKLIDQVHQQAANTLPLPSYEVCTTDEQAGKVFVLIKIHEGSATPYCTVHDPTVWVRTGNISTPLRSANREELLQLISKRERSREVRTANISFAERYFEASLKGAEQERARLVKANKPNTYAHSLTSTTTAAILSIALQPYYPKGGLVEASDLLNNLQDYLKNQYFNSILSKVRPITLPGGVSGFSWDQAYGTIHCAELFTNGLSFYATDVLRTENTGREVAIGNMAVWIGYQLKTIQAYYLKAGYSGLIEGVVKLKGGLAASVPPLKAGGHYSFDFREAGKILLPEYELSFELDTNTLKDSDALKGAFKKAVQELSWALGAGEIPDNILEDWIKQSRALL